VANEFNCDLHILHVQSQVTVIPFLYDGTVSGSLFHSSPDKAEGRMAGLLDEYKSRLNDGLLMTTEVVQGNWQKKLKEAIIVRHIDLVLVPRYHRKFPGALIQQININRLSQQTQCPVLTVTQGFDIKHMQHIVVPVSDVIPVRKLVVATYLARKFNGIIHLMGQKNSTLSTGSAASRSMTKSYQLLRDYTNVRVHCSDTGHDTGADSTLAFARDVHADLIVVNTGKESEGRGVFGKWLGKYLNRESSIPVLTVSPPQ
jgi:hypothetical protein